MANPNKVYLIDISSFIFRAFYAVRSLTSPAGVPVNAVYGVCSMLLKILRDQKPEHILVCYDQKEASFRSEIYPEYKANRSAPPEELIPQFAIIRQLIDLMGIPTAEAARFEADDIIGTVADLATQRWNAEVVVVSGDKDFSQLVSEHISMWDTMNDQKYTRDFVFQKFGVWPEQFVDYLALVGDTSDNVPGVDGIGSKGAAKLLGEFKTLDGIFENLPSIKSASLREKLEKGREASHISKKLVTIARDIPLALQLENLRRREFHQTDLRKLLLDLNFKSIEKSISGELGPIGDASEDGGAAIDGGVATDAATSGASPIASAYDTSGLSPDPEITMAQLQDFPEDLAAWIDTSEDSVFLELQDRVYRFKGTNEELRKVSEQKSWRWQGFDLKGIWHQLNMGAPKIEFDLMLASYLAQPGLKNEKPALPNFGSLRHQDFAEKKRAILEKLKADNLEKVYHEFELPLVPVLYQMEKLGIALDASILKEQSVSLNKDLKALEAKIYALAGSEFNIQSPKQLGQILFENLKLPVGKKTKTGYSTDSDVLEKLKDKHLVVAELLSYRELAKLKSTYVDALPLLVREDGRIHSTFNQAMTATGRLSSIDPNLQNIPIRSERGALIRRAFIASKGGKLLSADYSQIELRILAHFSDDPGLKRAFSENLDVHAITASEVFGVDLAQVDDDMRRKAKAVNFGIAYGQGAFGLAESLGIGRSEAQDIINRYFAKFGRVREYIESTIEFAKANTFVETLSGRRRYFPELKSQNAAVRKFGERAAINAPMQGSASDLIKLAMIRIDNEARMDCRLKLVLQVHDELIFEGPDEVVRLGAPIIQEIMESVAQIRVPLKVNLAIGSNWDQLETLL